jgi:pterin-4a-carbinolamine dehydratase
MQAQVNLDNLGELTMSSHVMGANTSDKKDREVILNYTHQENIYQLWRSLRFGDNLQEMLQQRMSLPANSLSHQPDATSSHAKKDTDLRTPQ